MNMNEAETRAEYIDPKLRESGWGVIEGSKILREFRITPGKIEIGGVRKKPEIADYVLVYKNRKLAVIEAKKESLNPTEGVQQAKTYADKLKIVFSYSTNGHEIHEINMSNGKEGSISKFPTPEELWRKTYEKQDLLKEKFSNIPFEDIGGSKMIRYYQEIAVTKVMDAIAENKKRILLTLATGTGKTFIAFQIVWKLFQSRWNPGIPIGGRMPRTCSASRSSLPPMAAK
jgi:type I restriction enzyme R subunit